MRSYAPRKFGRLARLLTIIEESVEWNFKRTSILFKGFDIRNCVTVFYAACVAPEQSGALLDVTL